jgi:hypothetical protein
MASLERTVNRPHARISRLCLLVTTILCLAPGVQAQQPAPGNSAPREDITKKSRRKLARVSKPADFSGAGLLQLEYGYDGDFRAPDADKDQAGTASVLINLTEDFQFELDFDTFHAVSPASGGTAAGIGDTYAGAQLTAWSEAQRRPSLACSYRVTLPTANEINGLGTGRIDHKAGLLTSKKVNGTDVDVNASLLVNGSPTTQGWDAGFQLALGFSRELNHRVSVQGEIFGETLDADQPRGLFVQGGLTFQPTARASVDLGVRAGLNSTAPRFGIFAGGSFALASVHHEGRSGK